MAGLVLGIESVPDGLASGLLAGVNPLAGLYAYLYGMVGATLFTSTAFMAVQGTGAMAIIVADVDLAGRDDPAKSLFTLSIVTGVVMIMAGVLRLRLVPPIRVELGDDRLHHRCRCQHRARPARQLHRLCGRRRQPRRCARSTCCFNLDNIDVPTITVGAVDRGPDRGASADQARSARDGRGDRRLVGAGGGVRCVRLRRGARRRHRRCPRDPAVHHDAGASRRSRRC